VNFDARQTDELLATTRAVRKRLDFDRSVPRATINDCITLSQQAPTEGNSLGWRWVLVEDREKRAALAEFYRKGAAGYLQAEGDKAREAGDSQTLRVFDSSLFG